MRSPVERFWPKVTRTSTCWLWAGTTCGGYGLFWDGARLVRAHRFSYELEHGPIPSGLTLDHLCRVRPCVNPAHLDPVSMIENIRRGTHATKTHCKQGHPFDGDNLYVYANGKKKGHRGCRKCAAIAATKYKKKLSLTLDKR